jgi:hypothetical protein
MGGFTQDMFLFSSAALGSSSWRVSSYLYCGSVYLTSCCAVLRAGTKDDFYMRHLIRNQLLDPVMGAFFANGERYNLLNSAVLELVEFIRKENIKVRGTAKLTVSVVVCSGGSWGTV